MTVTPPTLTRLTLGTAQLGMGYGVANTRGHLSELEAFRVLDAAIEHGVRSLDTAPAYGDAEARIGAWRARVGGRVGARVGGRVELCITTKVGALPADVAAGQLEAHVAAVVEGSLRRLAADGIDFLLLHDAGDLRRFGDALVSAMLAVRARGLVGAIGVSTYTPADVELVLRTPALTAAQVPLNMLDRRLVDSGLLRALADRGVTVFARSAYLQGALSLRALPPRLAALQPWLEALRTIGARHGVDPTRVAISWCARQAGVTSVVVGAESAEQVAENAALLQRHVSERDARFDTDFDAKFDAELAAAFAHVPVEVLDPSRWPSS